MGPERDRKGHNQRQQGSYCRGSPPCSNDAWNVSQEPESLTSLREDEQMKQHWEQCGSRRAFYQAKAQIVVILSLPSASRCLGLNAHTGRARVRTGCFWLVSHRFDLLQRAADVQQPHVLTIPSADAAHLCVEGRMDAVRKKSATLQRNPLGSSRPCC